MHETFESDVSAETNRVNQLEKITQELESLNYYNCPAVNGRLQSIRDSFSHLHDLSDNRKERIQNGIVAQQKIDAMRLDYAKRAAVCASHSYIHVYIYIYTLVYVLGGVVVLLSYTHTCICVRWSCCVVVIHTHLYMC